MSGIEGLLAGRTLSDRYRVEAVIGRGGMGTVYRATDERLRRQVAVKVISVPGVTDRDARRRIRARFRREAAAAARLPHHPNVVPVYDYGTDEALSLDFLVMELLRGEDLSARISGGRMLPLPAALAILQEAAEGVAVGHRSGLIHRDVKPGNVFLVDTGRPDEVQVRVLDFGIAKVMADEETGADLTQAGGIPHSPAYASPEQLRGEGDLSPASDVYSLGVVGFQLLTGRRPFDEQDRNRLAVGMPVEVPDVRLHNPAVPAGIAEVVRRSLSADPGNRPRDAGAFAEELRAAWEEMGERTVPPYRTAAPAGGFMAGDEEDDHTIALPPAAPPDDATMAMEDEGTVAVPHGEAVPPASPRRDPVPPRRPRRRERGRKRALVATLVVIALLAGGGYWLWTQEMAPRPVAVAPPDAPEIDIPDPIEEPEELGPLDALMFDQEGRRYFRAGDFERAATLFERAVEITPDEPEYRTNYGQALLRLGRHDEARDELERAIRMAPTRPRPYESLSQVHLAQGDTASALEALERVLVYSDDPRQVSIVERRMEELRAARTAPAPDPEPPPVDTPRTQEPDTAPPPPRREMQG